MYVLPLARKEHKSNMRQAHFWLILGHTKSQQNQIRQLDFPVLIRLALKKLAALPYNRNAT